MSVLLTLSHELHSFCHSPGQSVSNYYQHSWPPLKQRTITTSRLCPLDWSLAQLYAASWEALLNCLVAVGLYEQQVGQACFGRGTRKQPITRSSTSTAKQNGEGNADDSRGSLRGKKNPDISLQSVWWSVCMESHLLLHNQNRILLQIRVMNLKASCKVREG